MQPIGKWRLEEPVQEAPIAPVGKWRVEAPKDEDTITFESEMMFDDAVAQEEKYLSSESTAPVEVGKDFLRKKLVAAEGEKLEVYQGEKDKPGVLTVGIGHKLTPEELKSFSEGDVVTAEQVQAWYEKDSEKALKAATEQAEEVGAKDPEFVAALASVNFQLGTNWKGEHTQTWKLMKEGKFEEAADEAANSKWNTQTPERVEAFQDALRTL
jgi:GH24 family phage-related lysozyme (muramidase)